MIEAQFLSDDESSSDFRDAFLRLVGTPPSGIGNHKVLKFSWLDTPLGSMLAIADDEFLYLLEFIGRRGLEREIERLQKRTHSIFVLGRTKQIESIEGELGRYFEEKLISFNTPIFWIGSPFQKSVWEALRKIPHGVTRSYAEIAIAIRRPSAFRAVALANGANQFAIMIPCHRVINSNGEIGGYGGGVARKKWLLEYEKK